MKSIVEAIAHKGSLIAAALAIGASLAMTAHAQPMPPPGAGQQEKKKPNPCADEVAASLQKLRKSSWFRMDTTMITENGFTKMQIDYVLPDRLHQTVTVITTGQTSELTLVGDEAWGKKGDGAWMVLPKQVVDQLKEQVRETVLQEQTDVGNYACKGRTQIEGRDVFSYKLDGEPSKQGERQNDTFRMFYVDATTGLPSSNTLLVPGREEKPIFKTTYSFPVDLNIDAPKDVAKPVEAPQGGAAATPAQPPAAVAPPEKK